MSPEPRTAATTPITPADAARLYGTTVGYVYKLARRHHWRRIHRHGRVYYHPDDVDCVLGQD